jgi:8-amino-7-oxononanoate synthase
MADYVRQELLDRGWRLGPSTSQILPVIVGETEKALALSEKLREKGLFVPAIRPPTVPDGESCLRISLSYAHTPEQIEKLLGTLSFV